MGTTIRPELSEKNPYWIERHRYYELKHFCLQYSIRIRQKNGQEFIFTYHSQKEWKLETITSFLNGMKGGKK